MKRRSTPTLVRSELRLFSREAIALIEGVLSVIGILRQPSQDAALLRRTATLCTIDKPAEGEQDWVRSFGFSLGQVYVLGGFSHETGPYLGFDSVCVLRVRGMGRAASVQDSHPGGVGRVPQAQHAALEPV